jgi:hypothetical protein
MDKHQPREDPRGNAAMIGWTSLLESLIEVFKGAESQSDYALINDED